MSKVADAARQVRSNAERPPATRLSKAAREQQLLDTAEELFVTVGYDATSIEDIARAAGVTRPIIYEHFGSREGVLLACVERARAQYERVFADAISGAGSSDPAVLVQRGSQVFFSLIEHDPRRWALLFCSTTALSGDLANRLTDQRFATVGLIVNLLRMYAPQAEEERLHAFAHALSGAAMQLGRWWLRYPDKPLDRVITYYREFLLFGIAGLAGNEAASAFSALKAES